MFRFGVLLIGMASLCAQPYTLGVGIYPGDPRENFAPVLRIDSTTYRNLALHRPAYQSSSYDYNLTAQLITDGIKETRPPRWIATSTSDRGLLKINEREWPLDDNWVTTVDLKGTTAWIRIDLNGGEAAPEIDRIDVDGSVTPIMQPEAWTAEVSGSDDGSTWTTVGRVDRAARPTGELRGSVRFAQPAHYRSYRVQFTAGRNFTWRIGELSFFDRDQRVHVGGPYDFTSAWKSAGAGEEWVYVDLGAPCTFDRVNLVWTRRAADGYIQTSDDAVQWTNLEQLRGIDDTRLATPAKARYVRVLMTRPETPEGYVLSELEIYGRGGPVPQPKPALAADLDGRIDLAGGDWRLQRDSLVKATGEMLSTAQFEDRDWIPATVPGTVLTSYFNIGAIPDPNYGDNQLLISDSFFYADFWYRNQFTAPPPAPGRHSWLNFGGINWKADVYLNGENLGRIDGGFMRGRFDVSKLIHADGVNTLAVRVYKNATPGSVKQKTFDNPDKNGGALGADNPTFHASIGWDWIPTIRGRNSGIWNKVYLSSTGPVSVEDPLVTTSLPLPDTTRADVTITTVLRNNDPAQVTGTLRGRFGDVPFETPVTLEPSSAKAVKSQLHLSNPKLWWPNGYGDPNLYDVTLSFETNGAVSDSKQFRAGVRQLAYSEEGGALRIWVNGKRLVPRGGNWGFSESMLRYRAREYDVAVRYHRDMNFNMIRNWVGQLGEDAFYDACDKYGIVVWQDFWLANPYDGPDPDNDAMFLANVRDTVLRIRSHPSIGLYVGRNEGYPPPILENGIRAILAELHPGLHYIPSSADGVVGGRGPYQAMPVKFYFQQRATPKFHSEMGMPNIVTYDSLKLMMPETSMWPQGLTWGLHDFSLHGAQGGASFRQRIDSSYGGAQSAEEWTELAQFVNYDGYRAMYEAQSKNRMGLLIWMSHPCWPSFVWQTYDYYFDPTAAFFGAKKASEPLHVQWNPVTDNVEVVNYGGSAAAGLTASIEILNLDGTVKWQKSANLDSAEDSTATPIKIEYPSDLTAVHFLRLKLQRGGVPVSENFYWRGLTDGDYRALRTLPKISIENHTRAERQGREWVLTTELHNATSTPALMVHLKAVRQQTGDRILPAFYGDNYITLMPGESRTVQTVVEDADTRGEKPRIVIEGFNVARP